MNQITFNPLVHPSFKTQFDKLTAAYINGEVNPMSAYAYFVGNLLNGNMNWWTVRSKYGEINYCKSQLLSGLKVITEESSGLYTADEIIELEAIFMDNVRNGADNMYAWRDDGQPTIKDEQALFEAFSLTLDLLKTIHESKGEIIDAVPVFVKRELQSTL